MSGIKHSLSGGFKVTGSVNFRKKCHIKVHKFIISSHMGVESLS